MRRFGISSSRHAIKDVVLNEDDELDILKKIYHKKSAESESGQKIILGIDN